MRETAMRRYLLVSILLALAAVPAPAQTTAETTAETPGAPLDALCMAVPGATDAKCLCAAERFVAAVGVEDAVLYERAVLGYLDRRQRGVAEPEAWGAAVGEVGREIGRTDVAFLERMEAVGQAHGTAIRACG